MLNPYEAPRGDILPADPYAAPSKARLIVLLFLCTLAGVLYLDRICISKALPSMQREITGLTNERAAYVLMAFTLAYGIFEIPAGRLGDTIGSRKVLTRISLCWSLFTALTGACSGLYSLILVRFLFGAGEAGAYPNSANVLSRWFPASERGRAQGIMLTAGQLGAVIAPPLAAYLIEFCGWRWTFVVFGAVGVVWAAAFWLWFRDDPAEHPAVNAAERQLIAEGTRASGGHHEPIPWGLVARNYSIWVLGTMMVFSAFNSYFYFSWFPKYLESGRQVSNVTSGWLTSLVLAGSAIGTLGGGWVADWMVKRSRDTDAARRWFGAACFGLAALALWLGVRCQSPVATSVWAGVSCLVAFLCIPVWWSCAIQVSGRHVGSLFGLMNMMGVFGAMGSQYFVGAFSDWRKSLGYTGREQWDPMFNVYVGILLAAAACWWAYRSQPLEASMSKKPPLPLGEGGPRSGPGEG